MQQVAVTPIVLHGAEVGLDTLVGLKFRSDRNYTGCGICGALFQSDADRDPVGVYQKDPAAFNHRLEHVELYALGLRKEWSQRHSKTHSEREHESLRKSGRWCTPEAAIRMAPFGIIALSDAALSNETERALFESKPVPKDDVEGT